MVNANDKGKRFERKVANRLNERFGTNVRRTPMSGGMTIKGDIIDLEGPLAQFSFECKNQERLNIWSALKQSQDDAAIDGRTPVVVFTKNHQLDFVAMKFEDWMNLIELLIVKEKEK